MNHASRLALTLSLGFFVTACPAPADEDDSAAEESSTTAAPPAGTTTGDPPPGTTTSASAGTTGTSPPATGTSTGSAEDDDSSGPPPFLFDQGIPDAPAFEEECGKVDFLFVIDNSGSMGGEQATLIANFPNFISGIQTVLETVETYQVGVVTTDAYSHNIPGCNQLSSLVVQTGGFDSSMMNCGPFDEGYNFMTDMDDLATTFACTAQVGTDGSASERPMQAMVETVQRVQGGNGECNEGFIRDDALLVIVIITDESDTDSIGDPVSWYDDVLAAKLGIPENVVVVSIINTPMGGCPGQIANGISAFTNMWAPNAFEIPICQADYSEGFNAAVEIIDVACDNYIPPN